MFDNRTYWVLLLYQYALILCITHYCCTNMHDTHMLHCYVHASLSHYLMHHVYNWYCFPWDKLGTDLVIIPTSYLSFKLIFLYITLFVLYNAKYEPDYFTSSYRSSCLLFVYCICIWFNNNKLPLSCIGMATVSYLYSGFCYSCLCIMHLVQQRWVASTVDAVLN